MNKHVVGLGVAAIISGMIARTSVMTGERDLLLESIALWPATMEFFIAVAQAESSKKSPPSQETESDDDAAVMKLVAAQLANYEKQSGEKTEVRKVEAVTTNVQELLETNRTLEAQQEELIAKIRDYHEQLKTHPGQAQHQRNAAPSPAVTPKELKSKIEKETEQRVALEWSDKLSATLAEQKNIQKQLADELATQKALTQDLQQKLNEKNKIGKETEQRVALEWSDKLSAALAKHKGIQKELAEELSSQKALAQDLQQKLKEENRIGQEIEQRVAHEWSDKLSAALAEQKSIQKELAEELDSQKVRTQDIQHRAIDKIKSLLGERTVREEKVSDLERQLAEKSAAQEQFLKIIDSAKEVLSLRAQESKKLRDELEAAFQRIETLQNRLDNALSEQGVRHQLEKDEELEKLKEELQTASKEIANLQKLGAARDDEKTQVETAVESKNAALERAQAESKKFQDALVLAAKKLATLRDENQILSEKLVSLEQRASALEKEQKELHEQAQRYDTELKIRQEESLDLKRRLKKSSSESSARAEEGKAFSARLIQLEEEKKNLKEVLEKVQKEASIVPELQRELLQVKNQLLLKDTEVKSLRGNADGGETSNLPSQPAPDSLFQREQGEGWKDNAGEHFLGANTQPKAAKSGKPAQDLGSRKLPLKTGRQSGDSVDGWQDTAAPASRNLGGLGRISPGTEEPFDARAKSLLLLPGDNKDDEEKRAFEHLKQLNGSKGE